MLSIWSGPLPGNKMLASSIMNAFADDNFNKVQMVHFSFDRIEHCGKLRKC